MHLDHRLPSGLSLKIHDGKGEPLATWGRGIEGQETFREGHELIRLEDLDAKR